MHGTSKHQETHNFGGNLSMKKIDLGKAKTCKFNDFLILGFAKDWLKINNDKPLEFDTAIENNQLVLSSRLAIGEGTRALTKEANTCDK